MADGTQGGFNFPRKALASQLRPGEIVVDFFAGGGGASEALRQALGRDPDVAVNHDHLAIGMHAANHPFARHMEADVWTVDILREVAGRPVGWFHASPDCTHFSQAKGGQPRDRATRSLSWVIPKVIGKLARVGCAPRIFSMENVKQIQKWGPLVAKRDKATGRVVRLDGTIAAPGERTPLREQFLIPDKRREGQTWRQFVAKIRSQGCAFEWRELRACDYGAGTSRNRLFGLGRRDGEPIVWPEPTHGPGRPRPFVTAADCIDWSIPCPSIFTRKRPLAPATCRRIAKGIHRYVLGAAEPFIVPMRPYGHNSEVCHDISARQNLYGQDHQIQRRGDGPCPLYQRLQSGAVGATGGRGRETARIAVVRRTKIGCTGNPADSARQCGHAGAGQDGSEALTAPIIAQCANASASGVSSGAVPLGTITGWPRGGSHALCAAHLVKFRGDSAGAAATDPTPTITSGAGAARPAGAAHAMGVLTAFLEQAAGGPNSHPSRNRGADEPVSTISTTGSQQRLVTANMVTLRRNCDGRSVDEPVGTLCAGAEHHALVTSSVISWNEMIAEINSAGSSASPPDDRTCLSPEHEAGALRVAAFLINYYGNGQALDLRDPVDTVTTRDRLALVTVTIKGTPYVIVDIGLRMLRREELFRAQGFPADYIIDRTADGTPLSISASVRMVGNSVSPPPLAALARANLDPVEHRQAVAA